MTRNQTSDHNTITLESFARRIASAVTRFLGVSLSPSWNFSIILMVNFFVLVAGGRGT